MLMHLRVVDVFRIWDSIQPHYAAMRMFHEEQAAGTAPEKLASSWIMPVITETLIALHADENGRAWCEERVSKGSSEELLAFYRFFRDSHEWPCILKGLLNIKLGDEDEDEDEPDGTPMDPVEYLFRMEQDSRRTIEVLLGMPAEAFVSYNDAANRVWKRQKKVFETARSGGKMVSANEFILGVGPGMGTEFANNGESGGSDGDA